MKVVSSVGLLLFNPEGKILMLKELESKPHYEKVAGMLSFPIETVEAGEKANQTFRRLLTEEVGVPIDGKLNFFNELLIKLNSAYTEKMSIYVGTCKSSFVANPQDTDVQYFGWMSPREISRLSHKQVRAEVKPVMGLYFRH